MSVSTYNKQIIPEKIFSFDNLSKLISESLNEEININDIINESVKITSILNEISFFKELFKVLTESQDEMSKIKNVLKLNQNYKLSIYNRNEPFPELEKNKDFPDLSFYLTPTNDTLLCKNEYFYKLYKDVTNLTIENVKLQNYFYDFFKKIPQEILYI